MLITCGLVLAFYLGIQAGWSLKTSQRDRQYAVSYLKVRNKVLDDLAEQIKAGAVK